MILYFFEIILCDFGVFFLIIVLYRVNQVFVYVKKNMVNICIFVCFLKNLILCYFLDVESYF